MVNQSEFKAAMAEFASGVTVVTTALDGELFGMTVAAFVSVSLDPPLVLASLARTATSHDVVPRAGRFAVHVLAEEQADLAWRFGGASTMAERFLGLPIELGVGGIPLLRDALATVECSLDAAHQAGDHTLYVGRVERTTLRAEPARPLILHRRNMFGLGAPSTPSTPAR